MAVHVDNKKQKEPKQSTLKKKSLFESNHPVKDNNTSRRTSPMNNPDNNTDHLRDSNGFIDMALQSNNNMSQENPYPNGNSPVFYPDDYSTTPLYPNHNPMSSNPVPLSTELIMDSPQYRTLHDRTNGLIFANARLERELNSLQEKYKILKKKLKVAKAKKKKVEVVEKIVRPSPTSATETRPWITLSEFIANNNEACGWGTQGHYEERTSYLKKLVSDGVLESMENIPICYQYIHGVLAYVEQPAGKAEHGEEVIPELGRFSDFDFRKNRTEAREKSSIMSHELGIMGTHTVPDINDNTFMSVSDLEYRDDLTPHIGNAWATIHNGSARSVRLMQRSRPGASVAPNLFSPYARNGVDMLTEAGFDKDKLKDKVVLIEYTMLTKDEIEGLSNRSRELPLKNATGFTRSLEKIVRQDSHVLSKFKVFIITILDMDDMEGHLSFSPLSWCVDTVGNLKEETIDNFPTTKKTIHLSHPKEGVPFTLYEQGSNGPITRQSTPADIDAPRARITVDYTDFDLTDPKSGLNIIDTEEVIIDNVSVGKDTIDLLSHGLTFSRERSDQLLNNTELVSKLEKERVDNKKALNRVTTRANAEVASVKMEFKKKKRAIKNEKRAIKSKCRAKVSDIKYVYKETKKSLKKSRREVYKKEAKISELNLTMKADNAKHEEKIAREKRQTEEVKRKSSVERDENKRKQQEESVARQRKSNNYLAAFSKSLFLFTIGSIVKAPTRSFIGSILSTGIKFI